MISQLLLLSFVGITVSQVNIGVCPTDWISNDKRCYHFVSYPMLKYDDAARACARDGAILLSVEDYSENIFVSTQLRNIDQFRSDWFTSGERDTADVNRRFVWTATNINIPLISDMWITREEPYNDDITRNIIVYKFNFREGRYGLAAVNDNDEPRQYICEISKDEVYRINIENRGFDFGVDVLDANLIRRGPYFISEAPNTIILSYTPYVYLECIAGGNPQPKYEWTRNNSQQIVTSQLSPRYTITNGRLSIQDPVDMLDAGEYQCKCSNEEGVIIGAPVQLAFATLGQFSNVPAAPVTPEEYQGAVIECPHIPSRMAEAVRFQWMRAAADGQSHEYIRPELNTYIFVSGSGKLYFSEVTSADSGTYLCVATLTSINQNDNYIGASQPPSRVSRGVELYVRSSAGGMYDPRIQDSFINVVPSSPVAGMNISLECFAYGTTPLLYEWGFHKWDFQRYTLTDSNRVLKINNVNLDDSGPFSCRVRNANGGANFDTKNYTLHVESKPEFLLPLLDKHLDKGTKQLTWRCEARAVPFPQYTWYKNGVPLTNSSDGNIAVWKNTLVLKNLEKSRDEGMYQCGASNAYGTTMTSAQLRILSVKPSFSKYPLSPTMGGAVGGTVVMQCKPEAAPFPVIQWYHNNGLVNAPTDTDARISMDITGDLTIKDIIQSDQGTYECRVSNEFGDAKTGTYLSVYPQTTIYQPPSPVTVEVNKTAFMYCKASYNQHNLDLTYQWAFNGRVIDFSRSMHFRRGTPPDNEGGLYITFTQFDHAGLYSCIATTQVDSAKASAHVMVLGPPSEPAGARSYLAVDRALELGTVGPRDVLLEWTDPVDTHGSPVDNYIIYGKTNFAKEFSVIAPYVPYPSTAIVGSNIDNQRRHFVLPNMKPGVLYEFKLRAVNRFGVGMESKPTKPLNIPGDAPIKAPSSVGGGGGKVGTLLISWTPLAPEDHNGAGIGYLVEWRVKPEPGAQGGNIKWNQAIVNGNVGNHSVTLGPDTYYSPYNVKVTPFNDFGNGPSVSNDTVMSAEDMPNGIPGNVYAEPFNESSLNVYWDPVPNTRTFVKGQLKGYKIFYWLKDVQTQIDAVQAIVYGDVDHGRVIGLRPDTWYTVSVIVFNDAGNGLKSEVAHQSTDRFAPLTYPIHITVYPHGENSVRVRFRGLSTTVFEEPLLGYMIRYWRDTDDIRNAKNVDCEKNTEGFLYQIQPDYLYHLRVLGYSVGGDGKLSSPETLFSYTRNRVTQIQWDPSTSKVEYVLHDYDSAASHTVPGCMMLILSLFSAFCFLL